MNTPDKDGFWEVDLCKSDIKNKVHAHVSLEKNEVYLTASDSPFRLSDLPKDYIWTFISDTLPAGW